jgi:hypothetical protein
MTLWRGFLQFQTITNTTFWELYCNQYSSKDFLNFIEESINPVAEFCKIKNFVLNPALDFNTIQKYPYQEKLSELKSISTETENSLCKLLNTTDGALHDHVAFFNRLFTVTKSVVLNKSKYPNIPLEKILPFNSYHRIWELKTRTGIVKIIRSQGAYYPIFWQVMETTDQENFHEVISHENYILSKPDLNEHWNELEDYTVSTYYQFKDHPIKDKMLFGTKADTAYCIKYYFRGEKIDFKYSKHDGDFIYPIGDRYQPALGNQLWRASKLKLFDKEVTLSVKALKMNLMEVLRGAIQTYDSKKGPFPVHAKKELKGFVTAQYRKKDHTTTKVKKQCSDEMIEVWHNCRYKRPRDNSTPNCERRKDGFCKWPEARRKLINELLENSLEPIKSTYHADSDAIKREIQTQAKQTLCKDSIDWKILKCVLNGHGTFQSGKINYRKTAKHVGTYDNDVRRRWAKIIKQAKKPPGFIDLLK